MRPIVWIPEGTPDAERERLATLAEVKVFPATGALPDSLGSGDLLVAAYGVARAMEVARRVDGLRTIQTFSAGIDSVIGRIPDGVTLCDAAGVHDVGVSEWVMMAILASYRHLAEHLEAQRAGTWRAESLPGDDLVEARVVIVGAGSIGGALETRLLGFGANVVRVARRERAGTHALADLPALLPDADVVVILLPLTPETRGVIGAKLLAAMRPGALLVNASRGGVVDTAALTETVLSGRIRAALDVTDPEPLPAGHPLWSAPGVIITPHIAGDVRREDQRAWQLVFDQVSRLARGEPLANVVVDGY